MYNFNRVLTATSVESAETIVPMNPSNPVLIEGISVGASTTDQPCEKCGLYPHPITAVRDLPPELQAQFPILDRHSGQSEPVKRRRVCVEARVITSKEIVQQLKAKEAGGKPSTKSKKVDKS